MGVSWGGKFYGAKNGQDWPKKGVFRHFGKMKNLKYIFRPILVLNWGGETFYETTQYEGVEYCNISLTKPLVSDTLEDTHILKCFLNQV